MAADRGNERPAYQLAALDREFLLGDSMRGVRFMMEYAKAEEHLRHNRVSSTIVVFGSARIRENGNSWQKRLYASARTFARIASERGGAICRETEMRRNVIATGGGPGIMEAANRGAYEAGALSIGFNIALPHEQEPNPYITPELCFQFHYFAMRKMHLAMRAQALIVFPGGFGTLDELFELLTLSQTGKGHKVPVILFDKDFWKGVIRFEALAEAGLISEEDLQLFSYASDPEEAWQTLLGAGLNTEPQATASA